MDAKFSVALIAGVSIAQAVAGPIKEEFPLGGYWSWNYAPFNTAAAGTNLQGYAERMLTALRDNNYDTIWFVHGPDKDSVDWFMPMMERYGIKGVVMSDFSNFYYNDDLRKGPDNVFKVAETCAKRFSKYSSLLAYTPRDEPGSWNAQHTDYFCEVLRKFDPNHGMVAVMQPTFYQAYVDDTRLEAICTDIYHFGGEGSRWIPSPRATSLKTFRRTVHNAVTAAARVGKNAWIMPQAFGNTWGPHYWDEQGRHWALPGAYFHWRMPTPEECRWQVWEAVRGGAKGVVFYLLNEGGGGLLKESDMKPGNMYYDMSMALVRNQRLVELFGSNVLNQVKREIEPDASLLGVGCKETPQFKVIGETFGKLRPHKKLLLKSRRALFPVFFPTDDFVCAQTFACEGDAARLGIIVSDDIENARTVKVRVARNVSRVIDLNGGELKLTPVKGTPYKVFEVALEPGGGALLAASFEGGHPGIPMMHEDFSRHNTKGAVDTDVAEQSRYNTFGIAADWQLRLKDGADATKPVFTVQNLTNPKRAMNTIFMNVNRKERTGTIFLDMVADTGHASVTVLMDADAVGRSDDTFFTNQDAKGAKSADGDKTVRRIIWKSGDPLPVTVPVGATGLEFRLGKNDSLREVFLWYVHGIGQ